MKPTYLFLIDQRPQDKLSPKPSPSGQQPEAFFVEANVPYFVAVGESFIRLFGRRIETGDEALLGRRDPKEFSVEMHPGDCDFLKL